VDEQYIMSRTGHRSEVQVSVLLERVSKALDPTKITKFEDVLIPAMNQEPLKNSIMESNTEENLLISILHNCVFFFSSHESVI
jgi:hypothetical protein